MSEKSRTHGYMYTPFEPLEPTLSIDMGLDNLVQDSDKARDGLKSLLGDMNPHDSLIVPSLTHLADSMPRLLHIFKALSAKNIELICVEDDLSIAHEQMPTCHVFLDGLVSFNRKHHKIAQSNGIAKAREKGLYTGRKPLIVGDKAELVDSLLKEKNANVANYFRLSITDIASKVGVSPSTIYRYVAGKSKKEDDE